MNTKVQQLIQMVLEGKVNRVYITYSNFPHGKHRVNLENSTYTVF